MLNEKVNALFEDEEFAKKFREVVDGENFEELKELFRSYGVEMSNEELTSFLEAAILCADNTSEELSEAEMEKVAGGFVEWIIAGVAMGIVGGVAAYKLRKMANAGLGQCRR